MFTVDTRKTHCPIEILYTAKLSKPGDSLFYGSETAREPLNWSHTRMLNPIAIIKATQHGDYCGSAVECSNHRVLFERAAEFGLVSIVGSHGYQALAYDATLGPVPASEELCEILEALEDYPLIDEDDHSHLEMELQSEAWNSDGRQAFIKALPGVFEALVPAYDYDVPTGDDDGVTEGEIDSLWRDGADVLNVNGGTGYSIETGCIVYFHIDDWCKEASRKSREVPAHMRSQHRDSLIERILHMAERCRVVPIDEDHVEAVPKTPIGWVPR